MKHILISLVMCTTLVAMEWKDPELTIPECRPVPDCTVDIQLMTKEAQPRWRGHMISCTEAKEFLAGIAADPNNKWHVTQLSMERRRLMETEVYECCVHRLCASCRSEKVVVKEEFGREMSPEAALVRLNAFRHRSLPTYKD